MKLSGFILSVLLMGLALADESDGPPVAEQCVPSECKLPSCRCSSVDIPGGLAARDTPQFVLLTFDDAVNTINIETYRTFVYDRMNRNNCPAGATFFVNHEYTDYTLVNELYNRGYEIGLHSITHQTPQDYWREANYTTLVKEFGDQINQMSHFANIPRSALRGKRSPFLQTAGDTTFEMMASVGLTYDSSIPTISHTNPGLWPYTLDYRSIQDCQIPPCPSSSIPGPWVAPMIAWFDVTGTPCAMVDACIFPPDLTNEEAWFQFIIQNFERHYLSNRAPFGFYVHEWFIRVYPAVGRAVFRFLDLINNINDVFMVNFNEMIDWVKDPVPINEYIRKPCRRHTPTTCVRRSCGSLQASHNELRYYMQVCSSTCPVRYPWLENPLGN